MAQGPSVLLLDDGELDDIQSLLDDVGVPYARVRGGAIVDGTPPPTDLLVATPRRIEAVAKVGSGDDDAVAPIRLVVVNEDSTGLREQLRRCGFDYLVRRPVHPEALRLLLLRCLYRGDEKRREPRVAVGFEIAYRTGLMTRRAVLADLSIRSCRLVSSSPIDAGRRIRVQIPEALETGDPVSIAGRILRVDRPKEPERAHLYTAAVVFDKIDADARETLELLIEDLTLGPPTLRRGIRPSPDVDPTHDEEAPVDEVLAKSAATASPEPEPDPLERESLGAEPSGSSIAVEVRIEPETEPQPEVADGEAAVAKGQGDPGSDRRGQRRASYSSTVPAFGKRALRVLVGRDLSVGGMRIEPLPGLEVGDRLHLAIYGEAGESPFLVWGTVLRDDDDDGMAVVFDPLGSEVAVRLERLVSTLPAVESLHDSETQAMGTVMSEILTR